jgi:hypothetical protein
LTPIGSSAAFFHVGGYFAENFTVASGAITRCLSNSQPFLRCLKTSGGDRRTQQKYSMVIEFPVHLFQSILFFFSDHSKKPHSV